DPIVNLYRPGLLRRYAGLSQREVFDRVTGGCRNLEVLSCDSKAADLGDKRLCFAFIDGNHEPAHVQSDFALVWSRLSPGGAVALHDYGWYLPQTTRAIDALAWGRRGEIARKHHDPKRHLLYLIKR